MNDIDLTRYTEMSDLLCCGICTFCDKAQKLCTHPESEVRDISPYLKDKRDKPNNCPLRPIMTFEEANSITCDPVLKQKKAEAFGLDYFHPLCIKCDRSPYCYQKNMRVAKCSFFKVTNNEVQRS